MFNLIKSMFEKRIEPQIPAGQICTFKAWGDDCFHKAEYLVRDTYFCQCCADDAMELGYKRRMSWHDCEKLNLVS